MLPTLNKNLLTYINRS